MRYTSLVLRSLLVLGLLLLGRPVGAVLNQDTSDPSAPQTPHPLLGNLGLRQALAYCTDRDSLVQSVYPFLNASQRQDLGMDTFIPNAHWAHTTPTTTYPYSPTLGGVLLDAAGWTFNPITATYRSNAAGYELALKLTTTDAAFRQTWAAALEAQLRTCGIRLLRDHIPAFVWFGSDTGLGIRDFEIGGFAWVAGIEPITALYACDAVPPGGANYMGWCNPTADAAVQAIENVRGRADLQTQYAILQNEFANDMPSLPLFARVGVNAITPTVTGFAPDPLEYPIWNVQDWQITGSTVLTMGVGSEPATLWPLIEFSYVGQLAAALVYGRAATTLNYDYQARLYESIPTLENGGAMTQTVGVGAGATVQDASSNVVVLAPGIVVIDSTGQAITYTSGTVTMTQLVITGTYLSGLHWSNDLPLIQADLELWDMTNCDPASGASNFIVCDRTASRQYNGLSATYTLIPGYLPLTYSAILPGAYPSERVLSDSRKLKDVPAAEWSTLPEMIENPIGLGPYIIAAWNHGADMRFTPNPFFPDAPLISDLHLKFMSDPVSSASALLNGEVHMLGMDIGLGGSEVQLLLGGGAQMFFIPSPTWEHIDFNFDLFNQTLALTLPPSGGTLTSSVGVSVTFPAGALTDTTTITFTNGLIPPNGLAGHYAVSSFSLQATDSTGQPVTQFNPPLTITIDYDDAMLAANGLSEISLNVAYWDANAGMWTFLLPCTGCGLDTVNNRITVVADHLTDFAAWAISNLYLPLVRR